MMPKKNLNLTTAFQMKSFIPIPDQIILLLFFYFSIKKLSLIFPYPPLLFNPLELKNKIIFSNDLFSEHHNKFQ